jgi:hypothetical protein
VRLNFLRRACTINARSGLSRVYLSDRRALVARFGFDVDAREPAPHQAASQSRFAAAISSRISSRLIPRTSPLRVREPAGARPLTIRHAQARFAAPASKRIGNEAPPVSSRKPSAYIPPPTHRPGSIYSPHRHRKHYRIPSYWESSSLTPWTRGYGYLNARNHSVIGVHDIMDTSWGRGHQLVDTVPGRLRAYDRGGVVSDHRRTVTAWRGRRQAEKRGAVRPGLRGLAGTTGLGMGREVPRVGTGGAGAGAVAVVA